jgi:hypothetical protein
MMNKKIALTCLTIAAAAVVTIISCKKEEVDTETVSATDNSLCEGEFLRILPATNGVAVDEPGVIDNRWAGNNNIFNACPHDSIDPADTLNGFPVTLYLDYGTTGCVGDDGKTRKGMIRAVFDSAWNSPNARATFYLENYYVNGVRFEGTVQVQKNGNTITQTITDGKCSKTSGNPWEILWNCTRTVRQVSGANSATDPTDDEFEFTGTANGTNREGKTFDVNITSPMVKTAQCRYITKGTMELTPEGRETRTVNFGDGTCDDKATLTIKGNTFQFTLQ